MKNFAILVMALLWIGCEDMAPITMMDVTERLCWDETAKGVWYLEGSCPLGDLADGVEQINRTAGKDLQVCGWARDGGEPNILKCVEEAPPSYMLGLFSSAPANGINRIDIYMVHMTTDMRFRWVLLHEMGHYFGAGHSWSNDDIMYPKYNYVDSYTAADLEAIAPH